MSSQQLYLDRGFRIMDDVARYCEDECAVSVAAYMKQTVLGSDTRDPPFIVASTDPNPKFLTTTYASNVSANLSIPKESTDPLGLWTSLTVCIKPSGDPSENMTAWTTFKTDPDVEIGSLGTYSLANYNGQNRGGAGGTLYGKGARLVTTTSGNSFQFVQEPRPENIAQQGRSIGSVMRVTANSISAGGANMVGGTCTAGTFPDAGNFPINNPAALIAQLPTRGQGCSNVPIGTADGGVVVTTGVFHSDELVGIKGSRGYERHYYPAIDLRIPAGTVGATGVDGATGGIVIVQDGTLVPKPGQIGVPTLPEVPGPDMPCTQNPNFDVTLLTPAWNLPSGIGAYGNSWPSANPTAADHWHNPPASCGAGVLAQTASGPVNPPNYGWPDHPAWNTLTAPTVFPQVNRGTLVTDYDTAVMWPTPIIGVPEPAPPPVIGWLTANYVWSEVVNGQIVTRNTVVSEAVRPPLGTNTDAAQDTLVPAYWLGRLNTDPALSGPTPPSSVGAFPMSGPAMVHTGIHVYAEMATQVLTVKCPETVTGRVNCVVLRFVVNPPSVSQTVGDFFYGVSRVSATTYNPEENSTLWLWGAESDGAFPLGNPLPQPTAPMPDTNSKMYYTSNFFKACRGVQPAPGLPPDGLFPNQEGGRWVTAGVITTVAGNMTLQTVPPTDVMTATIPCFPLNMHVYGDHAALPASNVYAIGLKDGRPGYIDLFQSFGTAASGTDFGWPLPNATYPTGYASDQMAQTNPIGLFGTRAHIPNNGPTIGCAMICRRELSGNVGTGGGLIIPQPCMQKTNQTIESYPVASWLGFAFKPGACMGKPVVVDAAATVLVPGTSGLRAVDVPQPYFIDNRCSRMLSARPFAEMPRGATTALQVVMLQKLASDTNLQITGQSTLQCVPKFYDSKYAELDQYRNTPKVPVKIVYDWRQAAQICQLPTCMSAYEYDKRAEIISKAGIRGVFQVMAKTFMESDQPGRAALPFASTFSSIAQALRGALPLAQEVGQYVMKAAQHPAVANFARYQADRIADRAMDAADRRLTQMIGPASTQIGRRAWDGPPREDGPGRAGIFGSLGEIAGGELGKLAGGVIDGLAAPSGEYYGMSAPSGPYATVQGDRGLARRPL